MPRRERLGNERGVRVLVRLWQESIAQGLLRTPRERLGRLVVCWVRRPRCLKNSVRATTPQTRSIRVVAW